MKQRFWVVCVVTIAGRGGMGGNALVHWDGAENPARESALAMMPADAHSVIYADVADLRQTPFIAGLRDWSPTPQQIDPEYAQFLRDTGFDYERDLDRIAMAFSHRGPETTYFVVADGRFDRKKINTYTSQFGT